MISPKLSYMLTIEKARKARTKTTSKVLNIIADEIIRNKAYEVWKRDGINDEKRNWYQALTELRGY